MTVFTIEKKTVTVFPGSGKDIPVIYLHTFGDDGTQLFQHLQALNCPDFTLVTISNLDWNHDMAPWDIPPVSEKSAPCTGGADDYLKLLIDQMIPQAERIIPGTPMWRGIAGYSLAGLFAVYAIYQTSLFSRVASMSGSLWYPGIKDYLFSHVMKGKPEHFYFSLGTRECKTRNRFLKEVQQNTEEIEQFYKNQGIDTIFQPNPGGHYKNVIERTSAGILWLLSR